MCVEKSMLRVTVKGRRERYGMSQRMENVKGRCQTLMNDGMNSYIPLFLYIEKTLHFLTGPEFKYDCIAHKYNLKHISKHSYH